MKACFLRVLLVSAIISAGFPGAYLCSALEEHPDTLMQKAIWQYRHENFEEAYKLLKKIRLEHPDSSLAAYYLGITCKQLEKYSEAEPNLIDAVTLNPKVKNALPELIDVLYKRGRFKEAGKWIELAEEKGIHPPQIAFFKGLVLLKEGRDTDGAIEAFQRAKQGAPGLTHTADYYIGLAHMKADRLTEAKSIFREISSENPNLSLAAFADQYADAIERREEITRPFRGYLAAALQYDSNVVLSPDQTTLVDDVGSQGDWRHAYTFYGEYNWKPRAEVNLKGAYSFHCAKQFELSFYDMISHNISAQASWYLGNVALNIPFNYNHVTVNSKHYLDAFSIGTLNNVMVGEQHMAQGGFTYRRNDFIWAPSGPGEDRDSNEYIGQLGWFWFIADKKGFLNFNYTVSYDDTQGVNWRHLENKFTLSGMTPVFVENLKAGGKLEYAHQHFSGKNLIFDKKRLDDILSAYTFLTYEVVKNVEIRLDYAFIKNSSSLSLYKYTRNIYSIGMKYKF